ncbi:MAG: F0F1 ATP synthase subunit B [Caldimonas sp.]
MLIDWFTVGAQTLNFVLLVWLMKRFLYQPVLDAIAMREKRIADQIADATAKEAKAASERKTFEDKNTAFDQQRAGLLDKATEGARAEGLRLGAEAAEAAAALAAQRRQALATQAAHLQRLIAGRAAHEVFAVARKTLTDLANVSLEERMVEVFTRRLAVLPAPARNRLAAALGQGTEPALVRSRFELPAGQQAAIQTAINASFSANVSLRFETAADTVCGIELRAGGQKLAWTIDEYLRDFEQDVAALLTPAARAVAEPANLEATKRLTSPEPVAHPATA